MELKPDAYGGRAWHSAVADFLEVQALHHGKSWSQGDVRDQLFDLGCGKRPVSTYGDGERLREESEDDKEEKTGALQDVCEDHARIVFDMFDQRKRVLNGAYPFDLGETRLEFNVEWNEQPYLQTLCLTVIHGWNLQSDIKPTKLFPTLVAQSLSSSGLMAEEIPGDSNQPGDYSIRVKEVASKLGLPISLDGVLVARRAQDEGTDVVAVLPHSDERHCHWYFAGQVTCGKSEIWEKKAKEVSASRWSMMCGNSITPGTFLAVPHHVPDEHFSYIAQDGHVVLDRLRIVPFLNECSTTGPKAKEPVAAACVASP